MKLTDIKVFDYKSLIELIVELDDVHYEMIRLAKGATPEETANQLRRLAERVMLRNRK